MFGKHFLHNLDKENNGKWICKDYFVVTDITYDNRKIQSVNLLNTKTGEIMDFSQKTYVQKEEATEEPIFDKAFMDKHGKEPITAREIMRLTDACRASGNKNMSLDAAIKACQRSNVKEITYVQYLALMSSLGCAA